MKLQLLLHLSLKQVETKVISLSLSFIMQKEKRIKEKMLESFYLLFSHSSNQGERSQAKCRHIITWSSRLSYYVKVKLIKKKKKILKKEKKRKKKYHTAFSFPTIIFQFSLEKCQPITN